ncbi:hypothetical protein [Rhodanobacter lindaniclasticus]
MRSILILVALAGVWLADPATSVQAQSIPPWQERQLEAARKSDAIMREASRHTGMLAQFQFMRDAYFSSRNPTFRVIFRQYLSWYQTFIGDYDDAASMFSIAQRALPDDRPSPLGLIPLVRPAGTDRHPAAGQGLPRGILQRGAQHPADPYGNRAMLAESRSTT